MKNWIFLLSAMTFACNLLAQSSALPPMQYAPTNPTTQFEVQLYGGLTRIYCDVNTINNEASVGANLYYKVTDYFSVGLDVHKGKYSGGNKDNQNLYFMEFTNKFLTTSIVARIYPLAIPNIDANVLRRFYIDAGVGAHFNKVSANSSQISQVGYLNNNKDANFFIPLEAGISYPIYKWPSAQHFGKMNSVNLFTAYRYNLGFSDTWDGYTPVVNANAHSDGSGTVLFGIGFEF